MSGPRRRDAAAAVGTAIHHLLETLDLGNDLAGQVDARRPAVIEDAAGGLDADGVRSATAHLEGLLSRLGHSACMARLAELAPQVSARELEVFLKPSEDDGTSVISGAIDLVYTDPGDGRLVVADYKTDAVETETEIGERVERYRAQLETYARALKQALELDDVPHTELWFLHADRIVRF